MAKEPNLKVVVGADTSPFDKGMAKAKSGLKDFDKVSQSALSSIGNVIGVDVSKVQQLSSALNGASSKLASMGNAGSKALTGLAAGMKALGTGIAGLGIAGAVAAFKLLNEQAENFKSLAIGQDLVVRAEAFRDIVKQAMLDAHTETGRAMATLTTNIGNAWHVWIATLKGEFANLFSGRPLINATVQTVKDIKKAYGLGKEGEELASELHTVQREMQKASEGWAKMDREISELRVIASDTSEDIEIRQSAIAQIQDKINQRYGEEVQYLQKIGELKTQMVGLTGSEEKAEDDAQAARMAADAALANKASLERSVLRLQNGITKQVQSEASARSAAAAAAERQVRAMGEQMAKLSQMSDQFVWEHVAENGLANIDLSVDQSRGLARQKNPGSIQVKLEPIIDKSEWLAVYEELNQDIKGAFADIAENIGSSLVDMFKGEGVESLMSGFLRIIGGFAKKFGAALMSFGLAESAFFKSLASMNPATAAAAVAAGAALVAVGAALSSIASSVGGSGSYSSSNVASSSYGSGSYGESTYGRTMTVEVVGTLRANGSVLEAVINGENNRKQNVT